jgi:hypothetical protein
MSCARRERERRIEMVGGEQMVERIRKGGNVEAVVPRERPGEVVRFFLHRPDARS